MHICFLCNEYPPGQHGGIGSFTQTLARALRARGHQITVLGIYPPAQAGVSEDEGVKVIRLPHTRVRGAGFLINGARLSKTLRAIHRETPIDVLEAPENGLAAVPKNFPAAKVIRMHGGHHFFSVTLGSRPRAWRSWIEARSFRRADHLCAVSNYVGETTRELLRLGDRYIEVLPNPVDINLFKPPAMDAEHRGLIVFVGTVCEKKGVRQLIEAMPRIVERVAGARLMLIGRDGRDQQTGRSYTAVMRELIPAHLREHILFTGAIDRHDLPEMMSRASVCVYPSHMEALPVAWLEGMAMGKALTASRGGPGPEVIADGISGVLCDPHDPQSIAEGITRLLRDEGLRRRLGIQARRRVESKFSLDVLVARNEDYYRRCLKG